MLLKSDKTKYLLIVIILAVVIGGRIWWSAKQEKFPTITPFVPQINCSLWYQNIEREFDDANFCERNSDCKTIRLGGRYIEFGCYKFVNISTNEEELLDKVKEYDKVCAPEINKCSFPPDAVCINNKCVSDKTTN
ncbi:MAG: hypothetical protein QME57_03800 [Patescibacteria group bacterium]|nr:hypothetical protein [Patescibacteria group bacterium]